MATGTTDPFAAAREAGEAWMKNVQSLAQTQQSLFGAMMPGLSAGTALPDAAAVQQAQDAFRQAWTNAQTISAAAIGNLKRDKGDASDPVSAEVLTKVFDPRGWLSSTNEVDETLNRMAEGPRLADLWTIERKFSALQATWLALRRCNLAHNTLMLEAWQRAAGIFAKALNARGQDGKPLESARDLMALWAETANDVLLETQRTDAFLKSQRETLKASTDLRLAQQEVAEYFSQMFGYPTRAEIDDVHRSLTELRREVRAQARRRPAKATPEPAAKPAATAAPKPAAKPAATHAAKPRAAKGAAKP